MPEYLSPGVYVEEVSSGVKPIEGVGTSTGGFVGISQRGPIGEPQLVTNWSQFTETFGTFVTNGYLAYAVYQFFTEQGSKCYIIRAAVGTPLTLVKATVTIGDLIVRANSEGIWGNNLVISIADETPIPGQAVRADHFRLVVTYEGTEVEAFDNLNMTEASADYVEKRIGSKWIEVEGTGATRPVNTLSAPLTGGLDGDALATPDWAGPDGFLSKFDTIDGVNILAIPDAVGNATVTQSAYTYCENRKDCFFVADTPQGLKDIPDVADFRQGSGFNSSFGAIYYPWIQISDPITGGVKLTPPSGAIVGTYSHTDVKRGVHKAPAGIDVGYLNSAIGVEYNLTKGEHDVLNPIGVNVIRSFEGTGSVVWGARTLSSDAEWKYINVRRLFLYLEETIDEASQWVVFEPNTPKLWGSVKRNIVAFLLRTWRDGALAGTTADEAFFVKVDAENNPPAVVDAGQLIIEIGVAPVKPAEFVIIRIQQKTLTA